MSQCGISREVHYFVYITHSWNQISINNELKKKILACLPLLVFGKQMSYH